MADKDEMGDRQVLEIALDQLSKAITVMDGIIDRIHSDVLEHAGPGEAALSADIPADRTIH